MEHTKDKFTLTTPVAIVLAGALIAIALLYALIYAPKTGGTQVVTNPTGTGQQQVKGIPPVTDTDHVRGNPKTAQLTLVEYSDLQCPYCAQFHPTMEKFKEEYGDKIAWVYRHFPLTQIHPEAIPGAVAADCVAKAKGNEAFWRFIGGVFVNQKAIGAALYKQLALQEGISASDLDACIAKNDTAPIQSSYNEAVAAGGNGTPFTVILDKKGNVVGSFPGAIGYAAGKAQLDALLAQVK